MRTDRARRDAESVAMAACRGDRTLGKLQSLLEVIVSSVNAHLERHADVAPHPKIAPIQDDEPTTPTTPTSTDGEALLHDTEGAFGVFF